MLNCALRAGILLSLITLSLAAFAADMEQASMYGANKDEACGKAVKRATSLMSYGPGAVKPGKTPVEHSCDCTIESRDKDGKATQYNCTATVWINGPGPKPVKKP